MPASMVRWVTSALAAGVVLLGARPVGAQLSTDAVYEDARDVINGVIEREAVRSVARQVACHSTEGILLHYPRSLDNLYEERFDALGESFRSESARVMGAYAFSMVAFSEVPSLEELFPFAWDPGCVEALSANETTPSQYLGAAEPALPAYLKAYEDCELALGSLSPNRALACELGLSVEAAVADRREEAQRRLISLATLPLALYVTTERANPVSAAGLAGTDYYGVWTLLRQEVLGAMSGEPTSLSWLVLENPVSFEQLLSIGGAKPRESLRAILGRADWSTEQRQLVAAASLLLNPGALKVRLTASGNKVLNLEWSSLVALARQAATSEAFVDGVVRAANELPGDYVVIANGLSEDGSLDIRLQPRGAGSAGLTGAGLPDLGALFETAKLADKLSRLPFASTAATSETNATKFAHFLNAAGKVKELAGIWKEAERRKFAAPSALQALERSSRLGEELLHCEGNQGPPACALVKLPFRQGASKALVRALQASDQGSGVRAALDSIDDVFEVAKVQPTMREHARALGRLQAIVNTLVAQVAQREQTSTGREAAREAFKSAAYDWLLESGSGEGYLKGPFDWIDVSSGLAWSNGYIDSGGNGFRYQVSAELVTGRVALVRSRNAYLAAGASLFNLIGPFAEFALRDADQEYAESGRVWANFVEPRVDFSLGVPSFSRRLLLYAGVSWRPAAALPKKPTDTEIVYDSVFANDDDASIDDPFERQLRHASFGLGFRFVPH